MPDKVAHATDRIVARLGARPSGKRAFEQPGVRRVRQQHRDIVRRRAATEQKFSQFRVNRLASERGQLGRTGRSAQQCIRREEIGDQIVAEADASAFAPDQSCRINGIGGRRVVGVDDPFRG